MANALLIIGFLVLFLRFIYWIGLSIDRVETYMFRIFLAQFAEGLLLFFFFTQFFGDNHILLFVSSLPIRIIGFCLIVGGVILAFVAQKQLGSEWIHAHAYKKQKGEKIVTGSVYALVRHPLYTGIVVSYIGAELLAGSWLFVSLCFFFVPFYFQARKEEKFLLKRFGLVYQKYMNQTKMFIPYIW